MIISGAIFFFLLLAWHLKNKIFGEKTPFMLYMLALDIDVEVCLADENIGILMRRIAKEKEERERWTVHIS